MDIREIIIKEHGSNCIVALNGDAENIISEHQAMLDAGNYGNDPRVYLYNQDAAQVAAQEAYNRIKREVLSRWIRSVTREQMLGMLNALSMTMFPSVEYLPGESISIMELSRAWNDANPSSPAISINPDALPSF